MTRVGYRPEIDGLRALAVIAVIISHFNDQLLPSGYLGVDIFFVISGFVITQSLLSRQHISFKEFIFGFYSRRAKRLLPALVLCVFITSIVAMLFISPESSHFKSIWKTGISALFGFSNITLLRDATDYFGASAELNPFTHTWSLGVEEQFYLIFPLILWFSGLAQNSIIARKRFLLIIGFLGFVSLGAYSWGNTVNQLYSFYLMPTRFWELASGSVTYLLFASTGNRNYPVFKHLSTFIFALLIGILFLPQQHASLATFFIVLFSAILLFILNRKSLIYTFLTLRPVVYIGVISYSLYLWHWSVLVISRWTIGLHWWSILLQLSLIFILAVLSYRYVETPLRASNWVLPGLTKKRSGVLRYSMLLVVVFSLSVYLLAVPFSGKLYTGKPANMIAKGVETLLSTHDYKGEFFWQGSDCVISSVLDIGKLIEPDNCTFGDFKTANRRFLVIGSSFSAAEIEMYKTLVEHKLGSVTITSAWGASAVAGLPSNNSWTKSSEYYWASVVPLLIDQLIAGDMVILINDGIDLTRKNGSLELENRLKALRVGLISMSKELKSKGLYLLYQNGNPFIIESNCTPDTAIPQWWNINNEPPCNNYTKEYTRNRISKYNSLLADVQQDADNFFILDLFEVFCPGSICKFFNTEGVILYRDEYSHPSVEASRLAQPVLLETVKKAIANEI